MPLNRYRKPVPDQMFIDDTERRPWADWRRRRMPSPQGHRRPSSGLDRQEIGSVPALPACRQLSRP
jgi:hypothetical protein